MKNIINVKAIAIDMSKAMGMDNPHFWDHHGNTKQDYMKLAENIPAVQTALDSGKTVAQLMQDPLLKDTVQAYFFTPNMIRVKQRADGTLAYIDDGRHRIRAAMEFGYEIPVYIAELEAANPIGGNMWLHTCTADMGLDCRNRSVDILVPAAWAKDVIERGVFAVNHIAALAVQEKVISMTSSKRVSKKLGQLYR